MIGLMVPFAIIGSKIGGLNGTFWGLASAHIVGGLISFVLLNRVLPAETNAVPELD